MTYYSDGSSGTAGVYLDHVSIWGFVVGVAIGTNGVSEQTDQIYLTNCGLAYCDIGYSVAAGGQNNVHCIRDSNIGGCRIGVSTKDHGSQNGKPVNLDTVQFGGCYKGFSYAGSFAQGEISKCYMESVKQIGDYGVGASASKQPLRISGCGFNMSMPGWKDSPYWLEGYSNVEFDACAFGNARAPQAAMNFHGDGKTMFLFRNCVLPSAGSAVPTFIAHNTNVDQQGMAVFDNCYMADSVAPYTFGDDLPRSLYLPSRYWTRPSTRSLKTASKTYLYIPGPINNTMFEAGGGTYGVPSWSGASVTWTQTSRGFPVQNDVIYWRILANQLNGNPWLLAAVQVDTVTGTGPFTVNAHALFDPATYDPTYGPASGGGCFIAVAEWAPNPEMPLSASTTAGSTTLANVTPGVILAGDWITGTNLNAGTTFYRVISVSGTVSPVTAVLNSSTGITTSTGNSPLWWGQFKALATL